MKNKSSKKEKDVDVIARHLVGMEKRLNKKIDGVDDRLNNMDKKMSDIDFKLEKVTFSHGRRIEVLEDDMIRLKKITHKK